MTPSPLMGDLFLILIGVIRGGIGTWMILLAVERGRFEKPFGSGWLRRDKDPKAFATRLWTDSLLTASLSGVFFGIAGWNILHRLG